MSIGCKMRGLGESTYYMNNFKPKMDNLMGNISYEMKHVVGERKVIMRLDDLGETMKPQIEELVETELPKSNKLEYDPLPYGYTRVEYLESHGSKMYGEQYINIGILFTTSVKFKIDALPTANPTGDAHYIFGADQYENGNFTNQICIVHMYNSSLGWRFVVQKNKTSNNKTIYIGSKSDLPRITVNYDGENNQVKINGTIYKTITGEATLIRPFMLFGLNRFAPWGNDNDKNVPTAPGKCIIFYFNAEEGETKIDLIPVLDPTGAPCMFDLVSKTPFYNSGSGDFLYPSPSTTYSLRRYTPEYAIKTTAGIRKLYNVPENYDGSIEDYANEHNYKRLVEPECPNEEGKYYASQWSETDTELILEWIEVEPPAIAEEIGEVSTEN